MNTPRYDRADGDIGNLIALEHINLQITDQVTATAFYVTGLGLTRDPYMMTGTQFMWINAGRNQFHLMNGPPQCISGQIGLVVPDLDTLAARLAAVAPELAGTQFAFERQGDAVVATCPWGNRFRCHAPGAAFGQMALGLAYIAFDVAPGTADGIATFYRDTLAARARVVADEQGRSAEISVGLEQRLLFTETTAPIRPFDGHHIQVYVADFSGPHRRLLERGLITEESNEHQYRFTTITEAGTARGLAVVEHEVRSLRHPLYARPLLNRNPEQSNMNYAMGRDAFVPPARAVETDDPRLKAMLAERAAALAAGGSRG